MSTRSYGVLAQTVQGLIDDEGLEIAPELAVRMCWATMQGLVALAPAQEVEQPSKRETKKLFEEWKELDPRDGEQFAREQEILSAALGDQREVYRAAPDAAEALACRDRLRRSSKRRSVEASTPLERVAPDPALRVEDRLLIEEGLGRLRSVCGAQIPLTNSCTYHHVEIRLDYVDLTPIYCLHCALVHIHAYDFYFARSKHRSGWQSDIAEPNNGDPIKFGIRH